VARQLNTVLTAAVDGDGVTYFLKGQVLVTTTVLLIELDAAQLDSGLLAPFVELLLQACESPSPEQPCSRGTQRVYSTSFLVRRARLAMARLHLGSPYYVG